jgi:serine/threonine-protein kinase
VSEENLILSGRYALGTALGHGGMADVYLAEDRRLHRTVAVKVLRTELARDTNFQERFRREAQSAAGLNHPNIVSVYDTGEDSTKDFAGHEITLPYIVMEYVKGRTLREFVSEDQPMGYGRAAQIMAPLLSALEYSHQQGIVHRDIKPGNVMITDDGDVKVMDFGIARAIAEWSWAPPSTSPPSRPAGSSWMPAATSTPRPACSTNWSPAARRSPGTARSRSPTSTCGRTRNPHRPSTRRSPIPRTR